MRVSSRGAAPGGLRAPGGEPRLGAARVGHNVRVRLGLQALAVVLAQQHDAVPQEARDVGEQLQVEQLLPGRRAAGHAVRGMQAHDSGLHAFRVSCPPQDEPPGQQVL